MIKQLFLDIESSPNLAYVWDKWEQNVIAFEKEREEREYQRYIQLKAKYDK
jgi:hypothetical protein